MDPSVLIPTPDPLQVHPFWFQLLLIITFFLHILLVDVIIGVGIIAFVKHLRQTCATMPINREISRRLPFVVAFAVNFGIPPLLFLQNIYGHFLYASTVLMARYWLAVVVLLFVAYYLVYLYRLWFQRLQRGRMTVIGLAVALFMIIAFIMTNNFTLMQRPEAWSHYFDHPHGCLLNLSDPTLLPRYLHFLASAIAMGGLAIALFYEMKRQRGYTTVERWIRYGCVRFSYATIANFGIGFWFLGMLPPQVRDTSTPLGMLFVVCILSALITGTLAVIHGFSYQVIPAFILALTTIFFMVLVRDLARAAYLKPYFTLPQLEVIPQYSPMLIFLVFLLAGAGLIGWMLKKAAATIDTKGGVKI